MGKKKAAPGGGSAKGKASAADDDAALEAALEASGAERGRAQELSAAAEESAAKGDWAQASKLLSDAIAADPNNGVHYSKRSGVLVSAGRLADALADAKMGASLGGLTASDGAECFCQLGYVHYREGRLQAAREAYEKGRKLCAEHAGCRQGQDEVTVAVERHGGKRAPPSPGADDVDAQLLRTLPSPEEVLGRGFEVVQLKVGSSEKLLSFLISTAFTMEAMITPAACNLLGLPIRRTVSLEDVSFEGGHAVGTLQDCTVVSFVQAQIAEKALGAVLHGMLGLPFLARFDLDLDRVRGEQRFKTAGALAGAQAKIPGVHLPGVNLPGGLIGVPVQARLKKKGPAQAVLGIVDTGSMFSVISWQAAKDLGIADGPEDPALRNATKVAGATKEGVVEMPLVNVKVSICSTPPDVRCALADFSKEDFEATGQGKGWYLNLKDAKPCVEFGRVNAAIGDATQFEFLSDSAVGSFSGGAMLIGQDVLAQAPRLALCAKGAEAWLDPPGRLVDATPI